jgi:hypothetical protein
LDAENERLRVEIAEMENAKLRAKLRELSAGMAEEEEQKPVLRRVKRESEGSEDSCRVKRRELE